MTRVSCIEHPAREPFALLRRDYMELVDGNTAAAMLLSVFEHWTNSRLNTAEERGGDLWIFRTIEELIAADLCGAFGRDRVSKALNTLIELGYVERRRNPEKGWDRTWQYLLAIEAVQAAVDGLNKQSRKAEFASSEIRPSNSGNPTLQSRESDEQYNRLTTDSEQETLLKGSLGQTLPVGPVDNAELDAWARRWLPDESPVFAVTAVWRLQQARTKNGRKPITPECVLELLRKQGRDAASIEKAREAA